LTPTTSLKRRLARNDSGVWGSDPTGDGDVVVLRSTDIDLDGSWNLREPALRNVPAKERAAALLREGDVVVVKSSGSASHLGKTALFGPTVMEVPACFSNFVQRLRTTPELEPRYLWYFLNSDAAATQIEQLSSTTTGLRNISGDILGRLRVPALAVRKQRAIADYLDHETTRIDVLAAAKRRMVTLLHERWQVVMHEAVAGRLVVRGGRRATSVPWLTDVPSHWREGHLKRVAQLGTGHTPSRTHPEWWVDLTVPWITTGEVSQMRSDRIEYIAETRECISEIGMANSSAMLHPAGTVVLSRTASAGYSAIMGTDMATSQDFATWTCGPLLRPRFLLLCLRAMRRDLLGRLAMGSTHKTIYMPDIESIKVPIPPVNEQDALVAEAYAEHDTLDQASQRITNQIALLQERRQSLITAAVTGHLDIADAA
jgi:type I restriction enzyme S subunit